MGKNSKTRREAKKRKESRKLRCQRTRDTRIIKSVSTAPVITMMDNPLANITEDQRRELVTELGKKGRSKVKETLETLGKTLRKYDPITLIAVLSGYGLTVGVGDNGVQSKESEGGLNQSHVEILQALSLQIPIEELGQHPITPDIVQSVWDALIELQQSFNFSRMNNELIDAPQEMQAINQIQEMMRSNTQVVRNWGYFSQVLTISKEIYSYFDSLLEGSLGFNSSNIIDAFSFMLDSVEKSLTARLETLSELKAIKKPHELLVKYHELIGLEKEEIVRFESSFDINKISIKELFFRLLAHYDLRMADNYYVHAQEVSGFLGVELDKTKAMLEKFSLSFGELSDYKKELFFLDNPIWNKPIVKVYDKYFCPMPQLFFSFILSSLDEIIEGIDKNQLHNRRAAYLESKIERIVKSRFPEALTISGLKWKIEGTQYETDLITFIDSHAIIIEAKSQKISKPALRGAPDSIKRHLKEILIEPSLQSQRLECRLEELRLNPEIDDSLRSELPVNLSDIHKIIRVSVSLEDFSSLQENLSRFDETGWLPEEFSPCPTMNLADFETLFDFLEHPVQIIHYLERRTELEGSISFLGDELDFMGMYITTLLNQGNMNNEDPTEIIISGMSEPLDKYYISKDQGILIDKPQPRISKLFKEIFTKLEERSTPRWTEIGVLLNRFSPDDQSKLTIYIRDLSKIVNRTWKIEGHKNIVVYVPPASSEYALVYILYKDSNADRRDEFIEQASFLGLEPNHVKSCLIIAKNIDRNDLPYHFIALVEPADDEKSHNNRVD